jgi:thymidine kinase
MSTVLRYVIVYPKVDVLFERKQIDKHAGEELEAMSI